MRCSMNLYKAYCERFESAYELFLEENELHDNAENQEIFATSNPHSFADFEMNYENDLELNDADNFNDWLKAEGE